MSTLVLATAVSIATGQNAYQTRAGALIDASYSCLAASCPESFGECRAQTHAGPNVAPENTPGGSCNTMLDCHEQCQAELSKSATLACNQLCLDEIEPNARILYDGVQQCFATWCTAGKRPRLRTANAIVGRQRVISANTDSSSFSISTRPPRTCTQNTWRRTATAGQTSRNARPSPRATGTPWPRAAAPKT